MNKNKFLEKARNVHGYKYRYIDLSKSIMQNDYIEIEYEGIKYTQRAIKHLKGFCPEKKTLKNTTDNFIKNAIDIWGNKYDYSLTEYTNARTKIKIIYDGIIYEQLPGSHLKYPVEGYLDQKIFLQKAHKKWGNKYDYTLVQFKTANTKIKILYKGQIWEQTPHNHLKYAPERILRKTHEEFVEESKLIHDDKYNYDKTIYLLDREKVIITCPLHGDFEQLPNHHKKGIGCPTCSESKGEKEIAKILKSYNINFDRQKKFDDCKNIYTLPFDFYIPSKRMCIEFEGKQHYEPLSFFGGIESFEKLKKNDKIKNDYCEDNYINLIRIKYSEIDNIKKLLEPFLSN
jgi:very-short-patch-repair endonuclease